MNKINHALHKNHQRRTKNIHSTKNNSTQKSSIPTLNHPSVPLRSLRETRSARNPLSVRNNSQKQLTTPKLPHLSAGPAPAQSAPPNPANDTSSPHLRTNLPPISKRPATSANCPSQSKSNHWSYSPKPQN